MDGDETARFIDEGHHVSAFIDEPIAVRCPRCDRRADLVPWGHRTGLHRARRLACDGCGLTRDHDGTVLAFAADGRDPCFGYPLWYRAETSSGVVWAYHRRHLDLLRAYVAAALRERTDAGTWSNRSYFSRLPAWIKSAKNREDVLRIIDRMA